MSSPDSTIVVQTSTSASPRRKPSIICSSAPSSIWPCATSHARVGHHRAHALGGLVDRLDAVVEEERLPAALQLALDRLADELLVVLAHVGLDRAAGPPAASRSPRCRAARPATSGACAGSAWRDSESTSTFRRSWRSSSFCLTPKRCSSSTIRRPRSFGRTSRESSRWVPIRMSTLPSREAVERRARLRGDAEARDHLDRERVVAQPLAEGAEVLLGEDRGGHEEHHLLAVLRRLEGGAQRHLGLAVAHVAADQAVHRARLLHVGAHGLDRLELVGRLAVGEALPRTRAATRCRAGRRGRRGACARRRG